MNFPRDNSRSSRRYKVWHHVTASCDMAIQWLSERERASKKIRHWSIYFFFFSCSICVLWLTWEFGWSVFHDDGRPADWPTMLNEKRQLIILALAAKLGGCDIIRGYYLRKRCSLGSVTRTSRGKYWINNQETRSLGKLMLFLFISYCSTKDESLCIFVCVCVVARNELWQFMMH